MARPNIKKTGNTAIDRVVDVLDLVMAIELVQLEDLMQQAHECDGRQLDDPPEVFAISRQALRMLWHFRCNLDAVDVHTEATQCG